MAKNETECSPSEVCLSDHDSNLMIPTSWFDESKNEKREKGGEKNLNGKDPSFEIDLTFDINTFDLDKCTEVMKDKVSQEHMCEEEVPLYNNIGKQSGDLVEMPSEAVEQRMDDHVPDEIDGANYEQVPNHVVNKGNLEVLNRLQTMMVMN
ncbi:hypothetical protein Tco_0645929 [Tanacetum coccineum]